MQSPVEQIKERLSIVDVVSSYLPLQKAGTNMRARCPFHNEKTPSFLVSPVRQSYYCFGCGAKGDIFTFVETFEGTDFLGALKILAERAGVSLVYEKKQSRDKRDRLYDCLEAATVFFEKTLATSEAAKKYITDRGITDASVRTFRIGAAPDDWRVASTHLKSLGFTDVELAEAGLTKVSDNPASGVKQPYDRFRGRVMFPISDSSGRVIGFTGRILIDDGKSAKYLNSPDTELYDKASVFYGLDKAKLPIRQEGYAILVEGQIDLVLLHQYGYTNAIASSGTAVTEAMADTEKATNFGVVKRLTNNLVLSFDSDKAGIKAASKAAMIALSLGMDVKVVKLPDGMDPADVLVKDKTIWQTALKGRVPIVSFLLDILLAKVSDKLMINAVLREKILPFVARMPSAIDRAHFVKMIHDRANIPEDALYDDVAQIAAKNPIQTSEVAVPVASHIRDPIEEQLFGILFWQERISDSVLDTISFSAQMKECYGDDTLYKEKNDQYRPRADELVFQAEMLFVNGPLLSNISAELLANLEERMVRKRLEILRSALVSAEHDKDEPRAQTVLEEIRQFSNKLEAITKRRFL